jgi:sec-independent protein translocase protein TatA
MMHPLAFHLPFMDESLVLMVFGLLIFGKRLPEVGRSLGQGIVQFKKGLKGIEDEIEVASSKPDVRPAAQAALPAPENYKFDPVTGQPLVPQATAEIPEGAKFDPFTGKPLEAESHASV